MTNLFVSRLSDHGWLRQLWRSVLPGELLDLRHDELGLFYLGPPIRGLVYFKHNLASLPHLMLWLLKALVRILSVDPHLIDLRVQRGLSPLQVFVLRRHTHSIAAAASVKQYLLLVHLHLPLPIAFRCQRLLLLLLLLHKLLFLQSSLSLPLRLILVVVLVDLNLHVGQVLAGVAHDSIFQLLRDLVDKVVTETSLVHNHHSIVATRATCARFSLERALVVLLLVMGRLMHVSLTVSAIIFIGALDRNLRSRRRCSSLSHRTSILTLPVRVLLVMPLVAVFAFAPHDGQHKVFVAQRLHLLKVCLSEAVVSV